MCQLHPQPAEENPALASRRTFLRNSLSCGAYIAAALTFLPAAQRKAFAAATREVAAESKFARIEKVAEGAWALISTPQGGQFTTLSNGGIIAGKDAVLAIEGFANRDGAKWLRDAAEKIAGRAPTHVVLTHFHSDHIGGVAGYDIGKGMPRIVVTETVRARLSPDHAKQANLQVIPDSGPMELDIGGRKVRLVPRKGHTPSDVSVELVDPKVTWCGDLYWNGLFPNFVDAVPAALKANCTAVLGDAEAIHVPGHGAIAGPGDVEKYLALLDDIEAAARKAFAAGTPAEEAFRSYAPPAALGTWESLLPTMKRSAFTAWEKELSKK